jgi:hypothetical protein
MPKNLKSKKNKKIKYRKTKRNTKKYRKRTRGGVKTKEQIQQEMMKGATPITDPIELNRLVESDRIAEERERNNAEIKRINEDLERQRINSITSFPSTPMSPEDARRQQEQDLLDNTRVNSTKAKARKLTLADLGGSKRRKGKKTKSKKLRGGNRFGGNNIGANCYDPNFSIYNTNMLKLFPYKGGSAIPPERNMKLLQSPEAEERLRLEEEERERLIEEERLEHENEIRRQNDEDDRIRENIQNEFINNNNNNNNPRNYLDESDEPDMERLSLSELGGSKQKNKRKSRKGKRSRKSKKGGELQLDDPYKNSEGPQY